MEYREAKKAGRDRSSSGGWYLQIRRTTTYTSMDSFRRTINNNQKRADGPIGSKRKWLPMDAEARRIMEVGNALAENWSVCG